MTLIQKKYRGGLKGNTYTIKFALLHYFLNQGLTCAIILRFIHCIHLSA